MTPRPDEFVQYKSVWKIDAQERDLPVAKSGLRGVGDMVKLRIVRNANPAQMADTSKRLKRRLTTGLALLSAAGATGGAALWAQATHPVFMTGAEPIAPEEYDNLPKLGKFRAWLPRKVDLSEAFPKPGYQGNQPNCVAWATTYAARSFLYGRRLGHQPASTAEQMSPAYLYNRLRAPGSTCTKSIRIVDALNMLKTEGVVSLADFPDDMRNCPVPAPQTLREKASAFKLKGWRAVERETARDWRTPVILDDIKGALSRGQPVVFAMQLPEDWFALKGAQVYAPTGPVTANHHAMALIGYDEDRQAFRLINSWGNSWGDEGYAWIAYDAFKRLVGEAYVMEDAGSAADAPTAVSPQQRFDTVLAKMPCGAITARAVGGRLTVQGFAGGQDSIAELKDAAFALNPHTKWNVVLNAWPQCEAQLTLAEPLAVGTVKLVAQSETGAPLGGEPVRLRAGEKFGIRAETTAAKPYLSVIYLQADGSAVELYRGVPSADARNRRAVTIGTGGPSQIRFQVGTPFGNESIIAIASVQPLFGAELETYATERQFLTGLRSKLTEAPSGSVAAAVLRIRSQE